MTTALASFPTVSKKFDNLYGKKAALKKITTSATSGWDVSLRAKGRRIDPAKLREALDEVDPTLVQYVGEPKGAHAALRIAARRCQRHTSPTLAKQPTTKASVATSRTYRWMLIEDPARPSHLLGYALARVEGLVDPDADSCTLSSQHEVVVLVNEKTGTFYVSRCTPEFTAAITKLRDTFDEERGVLDANGLWHLVQAVAAGTGNGTVSIADGRVLVQDVGGLERLQAGLDEAWQRAHGHTNGPVILAQRVTFDDENGSTLGNGIARSVEQELWADLAAVERDLDERVQAAKDSGRALRRDSIEATQKDLNEKKNAAVMFARLLGKRQQGLLAKVAELDARAEAEAKASWEAADARAQDAIRKSRKNG